MSCLVPVAMAWMTCGAYSTASVSKLSGSLADRFRGALDTLPTFSSLMPTYPPGRSRKRSTCSAWGRYQATYSALCSLDSVGKRPSRPYMSTRTRLPQLRVGGDAVIEQRVEVVPVALPPQHPRLVVDAGRR